MAVARITEVTASSPDGFEAAVREAFARASKTVRNITGLEVVRQTAKVRDDRIAEYRVQLKITFVLED